MTPALFESYLPKHHIPMSEGLWTSWTHFMVLPRGTRFLVGNYSFCKEPYWSDKTSMHKYLCPRQTILLLENNYATSIDIHSL